MFPEAKNDGNIGVDEKQNSLYPAAPVIKCFVTPTNSKLENRCEEIVCFTLAGSWIRIKFGAWKVRRLKWAYLEEISWSNQDLNWFSDSLLMRLSLITFLRTVITTNNIVYTPLE